MSNEHDEPDASRSPSRRRALKIGATAAALAWTTPTILSVPAAAQSGSGFTVGPNVIVDPGFAIAFN